MKSRGRVLLGIALFAFVTSVWAIRSVDPVDVQLASRGLNTNDLAGVKKAANEGPIDLRLLCLKFLDTKQQDLSGYLQDTNSAVKLLAAELTGARGSDKGYAILSEEFDRLVQSGLDRDEETFKKLAPAATADRSLVAALEVGTALCKCGDYRGISLARLSLVHAPLEAQRYRAAWLLETALDSLAALSTDLTATLMQRYSTETNAVVRSQLKGVLQRIGKAGPPKTQIETVKSPEKPNP